MASCKPLAAQTPFFSHKDIVRMAEMVKQRHGAYSAMIADFFSEEQALLGDDVRAEAWERVTLRLCREGFTQPPAC